MKKIAMAAMRISIMMLFFLAGLNTGCSTFRTDSAAKPYIDKFIHDMGFEPSAMKGNTVTFETVESEVEGFRILGQCNTFTGKVTIDPKFFFGMFTTEKRKTALVHHELAHCVCMLDHDDEMMADGCAVSIMHSYLPPNKCLQKHWQHYIADLYDRCGD